MSDGVHPLYMVQLGWQILQLVFKVLMFSGGFSVVLNDKGDHFAFGESRSSA